MSGDNPDDRSGVDERAADETVVDQTEARIALEIKLSFLEKTVGELSDVVHALSNKVDLLTRFVERVDALERRLGPERPEGVGVTPPTADDKPPHY